MAPSRPRTQATPQRVHWRVWAAPAEFGALAGIEPSHFTTADRAALTTWRCAAAQDGLRVLKAGAPRAFVGGWQIGAVYLPQPPRIPAWLFWRSTQQLWLLHQGTGRRESLADMKSLRRAVETAPWPAPEVLKTAWVASRAASRKPCSIR